VQRGPPDKGLSIEAANIAMLEAPCRRQDERTDESSLNPMGDPRLQRQAGY